MNTGWTAIYADGRVQKQYPSGGAENTFASVQKEMPNIFMVGTSTELTWKPALS